MRTLLVDCDVLAFTAASACEYECQWSEDLWTLHAEFEPARAHLERNVAELKEKLSADRIVMALSDYTDPWRKKVMPTYKAHRKATRKPIVFKPLKEFVHETYETWQRPGLEGDDILGILATAPAFEKEMGERVVVSIDKDLKCVPGLLYRPGKDEPDDLFCVSEYHADRWHMTQTLTGDATDGYPGCPKVGPKTAEKILDGLTTVSEMWPAVVAAYAKAGLGADEALRNARVARICRASDFDFKNKKVILWNPPS